MSDSSVFDEVKALLAGAARAHHDATGGTNPGWARWYAQHLIDDLNETIDSAMDVDQLENWLIGADRRYGEESPSESWPRAYAGWLLDDRGTG